MPSSNTGGSWLKWPKTTVSPMTTLPPSGVSSPVMRRMRGFFPPLSPTGPRSRFEVVGPPVEDDAFTMGLSHAVQFEDFAAKPGGIEVESDVVFLQHVGPGLQVLEGVEADLLFPVRAWGVARTHSSSRRMMERARSRWACSLAERSDFISRKSLQLPGYLCNPNPSVPKSCRTPLRGRTGRA